MILQLFVKMAFFIKILKIYQTRILTLEMALGIFYLKKQQFSLQMMNI